MTEPLRAILAQAFPDAAELDVFDRTGTGDHFQVTVASAVPPVVRPYWRWLALGALLLLLVEWGVYHRRIEL